MRTDATIRHRQTKLPKLVTTIGFDRWIARPGDLILYRERLAGGDDAPSLRRIARVIGTVDAPTLPAGTNYEGSPAVKNHICVMALADDGSYAYERWVDPADVVRCLDPEHMRAFMALFLAEDWNQCMRKPVSRDIARRDSLGMALKFARTGER